MNKQELIKKYKDEFSSIGMNLSTAIRFKELWIDILELDEPQKPVVPQFVADWIEYFKNCKGNLYGSTSPFSYYGRAILEDFEGDYEEVLRWIRDNSDIYARAWLDGYTVEKEKRYTVKMRATKQPLFYNNLDKRLFFSLGELATQFTCKQLEDAGFGEVFNSPLFEVEEVEE